MSNRGIELKDIQVGDTVVIRFGYRHTEHTVLIVGQYSFKFEPPHSMLGRWAKVKDVVEVIHKTSSEVEPQSESKPKPKSILDRFFAWYDGDNNAKTS